MDKSIMIILKLLDDSGMSAQSFIKAINATDKNLVLNWREGKTKSYKKYVVEIANLFNVSTDYILGQTDIKAPITIQDTGDIYVTDNNTKLLISLLNGFDDEFDKLEFICQARKLAKDMQTQKAAGEPAAKQIPKIKTV